MISITANLKFHCFSKMNCSYSVGLLKIITFLLLMEKMLTTRVLYHFLQQCLCNNCWSSVYVYINIYIVTLIWLAYSPQFVYLKHSLRTFIVRFSATKILLYTTQHATFQTKTNNTPKLINNLFV